MGSADWVVVLETGKLWQADLISDLLEERWIPYFRQLKSSARLTLAMPLAAVPAPGDWYTVAVPAELADAVRELVEAHRLSGTAADSDRASSSPGVWDYGPTERGKRLWKRFAWLQVFVFLVVIAFAIGQSLLELFSWVQ